VAALRNETAEPVNEDGTVSASEYVVIDIKPLGLRVQETDNMSLLPLGGTRATTRSPAAMPRKRRSGRSAARRARSSTSARENPSVARRSTRKVPTTALCPLMMPAR